MDITHKLLANETDGSPESQLAFAKESNIEYWHDTEDDVPSGNVVYLLKILEKDGDSLRYAMLVLHPTPGQEGLDEPRFFHRIGFAEHHDPKQDFEPD